MNSDQLSLTATFAHDDSLPRVPLPSLEDSCARFLRWCAPLLDDEQLAHTRETVDELLAPGSRGRELHAELERFDAEPSTHSWLDLFWPSRYLGRRDRIALNANFVFGFRPLDPPEQLCVAAELIRRALAYKRRLDDERIPPVVLRGRPQSMDQQRYLFSTTRIPGASQDTRRSPYTAEWPGPSTARHIVVFAHGRMHRLDVLDDAGSPYPSTALARALRTIRDVAADQLPVGQLTTLPRAEWAGWRDRLRRLDPANTSALEEIETALLCLCLDDANPTDDLAACDQLLHGGSGNRWYDKSISLIVLPDGRAGINVEHCELDGTTVLAFVDGLLGTESKAELASDAEPLPVAGAAPIHRPIDFVLDDELREAIRTAERSFTEFASATASTLVVFDDFGADVPKKLAVSPDAFVQLAYQLAHLRARGHLGATYESIATRQYRRGRTEAMRVITPEIVRFTDAMSAPAADPPIRREAFRAAAEAHVARAKDCQEGRAPEQHLWELQWIARRAGGEYPAFFESPGWTITRDDYLSTSSAPSPNIEYFGFGSTGTHCIGVAYVLLPDRLTVYLSAPIALAEQMRRFAAELPEAVAELVDLLTD